VITRLKIHGRSYHFGNACISVKRRRVTFIIGGTKVSMPRKDAAAMLRLWRRCGEIVRQALIRRLVEIDPNGIWTDRDARDAAYPPLTVENAVACILNLEREEQEGGDRQSAG
jgi:hypothetical protein